MMGLTHQTALKLYIEIQLSYSRATIIHGYKVCDSLVLILVEFLALYPGCGGRESSLVSACVKIFIFTINSPYQRAHATKKECG